MMKNILIILNFIIMIFLTYFSSFKEESYRKQEAFYLKLAPIDPRSLMQGDYMTLNYEITQKARRKLKDKHTKKGYIIVSLDENKLAHFKNVVYKKPKNHKKDKNTLFIAFKYNGFSMSINADTFLFQEGKAKAYESAKYSKVIIVDDTLRLISLLDKIPK